MPQDWRKLLQSEPRRYKLSLSTICTVVMTYDWAEPNDVADGSLPAELFINLHFWYRTDELQLFPHNDLATRDVRLLSHLARDEMRTHPLKRGWISLDAVLSLSTHFTETFIINYCRWVFQKFYCLNVDVKIDWIWKRGSGSLCTSAQGLIALLCHARGCLNTWPVPEVSLCKRRLTGLFNAQVLRYESSFLLWSVFATLRCC